MWSAVGLEHGVEMAARCASVSDAAMHAGFVPSTTTPTLAQHKYEKRHEQPINSAGLRGEPIDGVGVPLSTFTPPPGPGGCASPSNQVRSSYSQTLMNYLFSPHLSPLSCYATNS